MNPYKTEAQIRKAAKLSAMVCNLNELAMAVVDGWPQDMSKGLRKYAALLEGGTNREEHWLRLERQAKTKHASPDTRLMVLASVRDIAETLDRLPSGRELLASM
jgi:hypothetical protein